MRYRNYELSVRVAWCVALLGICATALGRSFLPAADGWYSWEIDAIADAPARCCFEWNGGRPDSGACNLDRRGGGFSSSDDVAAADYAVVYVKQENGSVTRVHALSPSCAVTTDKPVRELTGVTTSDSLTLLNGLAANGSDAGHGVVGAIALHGKAARDALVKLAREANQFGVRKDAIFFMGHLRSADTQSELTALMFNDDDPRLREHAAFAMSESKIADREHLLVQLAREDAKAAVRGKAWFWLAQTESLLTEAAIADSLAQEASSSARREAIFALSQLPAERAARALIDVVDNSARQAEDRKQALFWLAQSESDVGLEYLSSVLTD